MRRNGMAFLFLLILTCGSSLAGTDEVCHVGAQLHLQKGVPEETYLRHARAFVEEGMADYFLLLSYGLDVQDHEILARYLKDHGVHFLIQEPFDPDQRRHHREELDRVKAIAGDLFLGVHWGELDSSGLKAEAYLPPEILANPTRPKVKAAFVERIRSMVEGVRKDLNVPVAHSSALLYHPLFAEAGVDMICSEIGENIPNVNMMIASNRGAARAYGKPWMIDHSTWWSPRGSAGEQVSPREGHTPWCLFTTLLSAAMGGADCVQLEVDWAAYPKESLFQAGTDKPHPLLPWGQAMKTLYSVTRVIGPRGETVTPMAILMGQENGWPGVGWRTSDVRSTGLYGGLSHGFMQTRDADLSLKILEVFCPGFERAAWDPEYPGFLSESPLGTLDMIPDNLALDKITRYKVLIALGYHRMTDELLDTLKAFVAQGGILITGDTLFLDELERPVPSKLSEPLIGCVVDTSDDRLIRLSHPKATMQAVAGFTEDDDSQESQDHWLHPVAMTSGQVIGRLGDAPHVVMNTIGRGRVFFVTGLNMVGNSAQHRGPEPFLYPNMLDYFLHTLQEQIGDGIDFSPWTSLQHIYNKRPDGTGMLLVMNHGDMDYRRDATMKNADGYTQGRVLAQGTWEGWSPGEAIAFAKQGDLLAWSFDIPPKSFILYELGK